MLYIALSNASAKGTSCVRGFSRHIYYLIEGGNKVLLHSGQITYKAKGKGLYILPTVFIIIKRLFNRK